MQEYFSRDVDSKNKKDYGGISKMFGAQGTETIYAEKVIGLKTDTALSSLFRASPIKSDYWSFTIRDCIRRKRRTTTIQSKEEKGSKKIKFCI